MRAFALLRKSAALPIELPGQIFIILVG